MVKAGVFHPSEEKRQRGEEAEAKRKRDNQRNPDSSRLYSRRMTIRVRTYAPAF